MAKSLTDQLLAAGAIDKDRAAKSKKAKHKQAKQRTHGQEQPNEIKLKARRAQAEKTDHDRALSRRHQAILNERSVRAQVQQLIEKNCIDRGDGEIPYNFSDQGVVKKIRLRREQHTALADGRLAVARLDGSYVLIPTPVALKIAAREPTAVVVMNTASGGGPDTDDAYAQYEIPDDLSW